MLDVDNFAELSAELDAARDKYQEAFEARSEAVRCCRDSPRPDDSVRLREASEGLRSALRRYMQSFENLTNRELERG